MIHGRPQQHTVVTVAQCAIKPLANMIDAVMVDHIAIFRDRKIDIDLTRWELKYKKAVNEQYLRPSC